MREKSWQEVKDKVSKLRHSLSGLLLYMIKRESGLFYCGLWDFPLHFRLCGGKIIVWKTSWYFAFLLTEVGWGSKNVGLYLRRSGSQQDFATDLLWEISHWLSEPQFPQQCAERTVVSLRTLIATIIWENFFYFPQIFFLLFSNS